MNIQKSYFFEYSCIFLNIYVNIQSSDNALINIQINSQFMLINIYYIKIAIEYSKNIFQNPNIFWNILFGEINLSISSQIFIANIYMNIYLNIH